MTTAVLLSGGVDSSVALATLKDEGHADLRAFYLKIWLQEDEAFLGDCPWEEDLEHARAVCLRFGVPLEVIPLQREYYQRVVRYALDELAAGRTPSSDLLCNQQIKFGAFFDAVDGEIQSVASGHYAQRLERDGRALLARNPDPVKDQTYFLARLDRVQLERCRFPLGRWTKAQVRERALALDLPNSQRPDSQGICFLGKIPFDDFVRHHLGERPGPIVRQDTGEGLGEHRGLWFYTIGQRRGLGLSGGPWYVVDKQPEDDVLLVTHGQQLAQHSTTRFEVDSLHWLCDSMTNTAEEELSLEVKVRHGPQLTRCRFQPQGDLRGLVELESPDPGIAPGQFAVFYRDEICLGCGVIRGALPS
ncbi:MAG: tRNA 2-thiouridine(34) synthase MnmA [Acidobacteriota bacterium]